MTPIQVSSATHPPNGPVLDLIVLVRPLLATTTVKPLVSLPYSLITDTDIVRRKVRLSSGRVCTTPARSTTVVCRIGMVEMGGVQILADVSNGNEDDDDVEGLVNSSYNKINNSSNTSGHSSEKDGNANH
ncbi:hypothetical protein L6452_05775 [Arctium lappa]|uniref:Uncharacterized protein n=1 Tax=Arctium lappa TaxID=4217 RepID=A0ACB9EHD9_ARCLA|nr:hypothetical protein L6452_05775 [Arctium lappa]